MFEIGDRVVIRSVHDTGFINEERAWQMLGQAGVISRINSIGFEYWITPDNADELDCTTWAANGDEIEREN